MMIILIFIAAYKAEWGQVISWNSGYSLATVWCWISFIWLWMDGFDIFLYIINSYSSKDINYSHSNSVKNAYDGVG